VLYGWLGINIKWVMKSELRKVPVFGYAGEKGSNIYVDRSSPEALRRTLDGARSKIVGGTSIIMLPEGTRPRNQELMRTISVASVIWHSQTDGKVSARTAVLLGPGGRNNIRIHAGL
jgi:1-acyl-sn-glycerol-3-phosphate acyltransferase